MAHADQVPGQAYRPEMDGQTHEKTYDGFVVFTTIATSVVLCWVLALAIGGVKDGWMTAIVGVLLSGVAGTIGALFPSVGWRAPVAVLVLLILLFVLY